MIIRLSEYNYITENNTHTDIQHTINLDAITYIDTEETLILLPYQMDATTAERLQPLLYEFALYGTSQTFPAFDGLLLSDNYDDIIKDVSYRLSVNIQPWRKYVGLHTTITPTIGKCRTYHILCDTPQEEITAIAKRYLSKNELPYMWHISGIVAI